jgi:hypothetical protein
MKKLMIFTFLSSISSVCPASTLLKLAGVEVYAADSERKLKIDQVDLSVLDGMKEEFKKSSGNFEVFFVRDQKILVTRGKDFLAAFDEKGEILQFSGPMQIKLEGKNEVRVEFVDLVKM